jgi:hypothetical protein
MKRIKLFEDYHRVKDIREDIKSIFYILEDKGYEVEAIEDSVLRIKISLETQQFISSTLGSKDNELNQDYVLRKFNSDVENFKTLVIDHLDYLNIVKTITNTPYRKTKQIPDSISKESVKIETELFLYF